MSNGNENTVAKVPTSLFLLSESESMNGVVGANKEHNGEASSQEVMLTQVRQIPIERIARSPYQVRDFAREQNLEELANSIEALGILQPLLLRPRTGQIPPYELIAGERRLRAAELAGMQEVPALILALDDRETLQAAIVENAQRENLNPIEEALAYQRLSEDFRLTQRAIAESVGKKRATVSNSLRLLQLSEPVITLLLEGALSAGHGRALLTLEDPEEQLHFAKKAVTQNWSVHVLERKLEAERSGIHTEDADSEQSEALQQQLTRQQQRVSEYLGLDQVQLRLDKAGKKCLNLVFESEAAWKRFVAKIRE